MSQFPQIYVIFAFEDGHSQAIIVSHLDLVHGSGRKTAVKVKSIFNIAYLFEPCFHILKRIMGNLCNIAQPAIKPVHYRS